MALCFKTIDIEVSNFTIELFSPKTRKFHKFKKVLSYFMYFDCVFTGLLREELSIIKMKELLLNNMVKLTSLLNIMTNLNKIMTIIHLKESIKKIIMKFTNFNEVKENYSQK